MLSKILRLSIPFTLLGYSVLAEEVQNKENLVQDYLHSQNKSAEILSVGEYYDTEEGSNVLKVKVKENGNVSGFLLDPHSKKKIVKQDRPQKTKLGYKLEQVLDAVSDDTELEVEIYFDVPLDHSIGIEPTSATFDARNPEHLILKKNGKLTTEKELEEVNEELRKHLINKQNKRNAAVRELTKQFREQEGILEGGNEKFIKLKASKKKVRQFLKRHREKIKTITVKTPQPKLGLWDANHSINVSQYAHPYGEQGQFIGMYMNEPGVPDSNNPDLDFSRVTLVVPGQSSSAHATQVAISYFSTAPQSHIYTEQTPVHECNTKDDILSYNNPKIYIASLSWSYNWDYPYQHCDRVWDNYIYEKNISAFMLAHNQEPATVGTPGKGLNVITVGAYNDSNNTMASFSSSGNSNHGNEKPEIVAPGVGLDVGQWNNIQGTSYSTPLAAGFGADLTSWLPGFFGYHPEALKAMMMAGATNNIEGASRKCPIVS